MAKQRILQVLVGVVAVAALAAFWARDETEPSLSAAAVQRVAPAPAAVEVAADSVVVARGGDQLGGQRWGELFTAALAAPVAATEDDTNAIVVRGRLTVRQQPWLHPANLELHATRSWLDSVVPVEADPAVRAPRRDDPRTRTDADGRFALRLQPLVGEVFVLIGRGTPWQDLQRLPKLPPPGASIDLGDVFLDQRGSIVGRVPHGSPTRGPFALVARAVDDPLLDGRAVFEEFAPARTECLEFFRSDGVTSGGLVPSWVAYRDRYLPFPQCEVAPDGSFRLEGVRPGNHDLVVTGSGRQARARGVLVQPGMATDVGTLELQLLANVELRFVDQSNQPWADAAVAFVHAAAGHGSAHGRTDRRGWVRLRVAEPAACSVLLQAAAGQPWHGAGAWQPDRTTIVVPQPRQFEVMLVDLAGTPIEGGRVRSYCRIQQFRPLDQELPAAWQPVESSPGRFRARAPWLGSVMLVASAPGFAPAVASWPDVVAGKRGPLALPLRRLQSMLVVVRDAPGAPIADAEVWARVEPHPDDRSVGTAWAAPAESKVWLGQTAANGELVVPTWDALFSFQVAHRDYATAALPRVAGHVGRCEVTLQLGGDLAGTLVLGHRAAPPGIRVRARQQPAATDALAASAVLAERLGVTGVDGDFGFRNLMPGSWDLVPELPPVPHAAGARSPAAFAAQRVHVEPGRERHYQVPILRDRTLAEHAAAILQGRITMNGAAVPQALVRVRAPAPRAAPPRMDRRDGSRPAVLEPPWTSRAETDEFGEFSLPDLEPQRDYELRIDVPGHGRLQFVGMQVVRTPAQGATARHDVALQGSAVHLFGSLGTTAAAGRMVSLRQLGADGRTLASYDLLLDAVGQAFVPSLARGTWQLAPAFGGSCSPARFEVAGEPVKTVDFVLQLR